MGIQIDGIVSGLDTTAIIDATLEVVGLPMNSMELSLADYEARLEGVSGLTSRLNDLVTALEAVDEDSELMGYTSASTDDSVVVATASSDSVAGTYSLTVSALATANINVADGLSDASSTGVVQEGTLSVTVNGTTTDITVDSSNSSLEDIAAALDAIEGVNSYIIDDGSGTDSYRLVVHAAETGTDNAVSVDTSGLSGAGSALTFTETETAADALVTVNGVTVTSSTNSVEAIPGVTFELLSASLSSVDVTVTQDLPVTIDAIQAVVDAYNEVINYYNDQTVYDYDAGVVGNLVGETGAARVIAGIRSTITDAFSLDSTLSSLAQIGVSTNITDGSLELDTTKLEEALAESYDDVVALFTDENGPATVLKNNIEDLYIDSESGTLAVRSDSIEETIADYEDQIFDFEVYLADYEQNLRQRYTALESILGQIQAAQSSLLAMLGSTAS